MQKLLAKVFRSGMIQNHNSQGTQDDDQSAPLECSPLNERQYARLGRAQSGLTFLCA